MSCSEVMYQAYYPYLYQRPGVTPAHPVPRAGPFSSPFSTAHQYDRFNVQRLQESPNPSITASNTISVATASSRVLDSTHSTTTTASVVAGTEASSSYSNTSTPSSPRSHSLPSATASISLQPPLSIPDVSHKEEDSNNCAHGDDSCCSEEGGDSPGISTISGSGSGAASGAASTAGANSRAQYMSANCVVVTHYQGDAASVVDEHFTKALDKTHLKEVSPMSARNFPASFWNSTHHYNADNSISGISTSTSDGLYHQSDGAYHPSDWYHQYSQYHHHHHHQHHHHPIAAAAASYGGLLLPPPGSRLHMSAAAAGAAAAQCKAMDWQHAATAATLDNPYTTYSNMSACELHPLNHLPLQKSMNLHRQELQDLIGPQRWE